MNKKLVAFLLSTGILVSTCGTAFANNNDGRVDNTNTVAPTPPTTQVEGQITNDIVNIPANEEKPNFEIHDITLLKKDFDDKAKECEKLINEINKLTIILDKEGVEIKRVTEDYKKGMREAHERGEDLAEIIKKFDTLKDPLMQKTLSNEECDKYNNLCKQLKKAMNDLADIGNTITQTPHIDSSRLSDECREKYNELLSDVIAVTGKYTKEINEHATNMDKLWKTSREALVTLQQELENPKLNTDEEIKQSIAKMEKARQEAIDKIKNMVNALDDGLAKAEMDKELANAKAELENIISNIDNMDGIYAQSLVNPIIDKYEAKIEQIRDEYDNKRHAIDNVIKEEQNIKATITYQDYREFNGQLENYENKITTHYQTTYAELKTLQAEYEKKIEDAVKNKENKTTNTTSTVSETGNRLGSNIDSSDFDSIPSSNSISRIGSSSIDSSDFDSIPSSNSISRIGTSSPKTGDYTTLGASIATMIAGVAGIFVSRKR